jgi:hypothetical protein
MVGQQIYDGKMLIAVLAQSNELEIYKDYQWLDITKWFSVLGES